MNTDNGYVQLKVMGEDTYLIVYAPENMGKAPELNQVTSYLERNMLTEYNLKELSEALKVKENSVSVRVGMAPIRPFNETMNIDVSLDRMLAFCRFTPPSEGGSLMDAKEIVEELNSQKIKCGIDENEIAAFLAHRNYRKEYILAKGSPAVQGHDAKIEYFFNTRPSTKPKRNEDGTVNYHELNTISKVDKDQLVACLHPEDKGTDGSDIMGNVIKPRQIKTVKLEFGNQLRLSEDRTQLFSNVTGHASLVNGKVFVSDVFEVPADVDNSVGDIDYNGNVHINGNVKNGFTVCARGDIVVDGVVEGANLIADGQIIIKQGVHGMTKGKLQAKGNIILKFIENAEVKSGGYLETESILHSQVSAFSEVHIAGKKGFVTGGTIRAGKLVEAQIIGSEMGTLTKIEVGIEPDKKERYGRVRQSLDQIRKDMDQIKPILTTYAEKLKAGEELSPEKQSYLQKLALSMKSLQVKYTEENQEMMGLHEELMMSEDAKIKVHKDIYPGVLITIGDVSMTTKDHRSFCQFTKKGADIVTDNL